MPPCVTLIQSSRIPQTLSFSAAGPDSCVVLQQTVLTSSPKQGWTAPLERLRDAHPVTYGSCIELSAYQDFVSSCVKQAQELVLLDAHFSECRQTLLSPLTRAHDLVRQGKTSMGRELAVSLLGYHKLAQLAEQLKLVGNARDFGGAGTSAGEPTSSSTSSSGSSSSSSGQFKVPALPLKRQRSPNSDELQQELPQAATNSEPVEQQQRRHNAPKRRATPQVWSGGPNCITPSAPPSSSMHGETCCDETLLPYWCPISGERLSTEPQPSSPAAVNSSDSCAGMQGVEQEQVQAKVVPAAAVQSWAAEQQHKDSLNAAAPRASSTSTRSSSFMQLGSAQQLPAPALPPSGRAAVSTARSDAIEALKRSMHEDPASKPAADVLLFNKAKQLPIVNWTGPIKHKAAGRVVELCSLTLQVPEAFLEEFPAAIYAAEIRHRKSVSLGRHVVCRANLQPLSEHQLAGLATMARQQLVALCMLQTAELHMVPYFDNKNHVRCVGFLKIKAT